MRQNFVLRIVISCVAIIVIAAHTLDPAIRIDSITIALLVICALPWLQPLVKTVEIPGFKVELQQLQESISDAKGAAESANMQASLALSASKAAQTAVPQRNGSGAEALIEHLASEYDHIRLTQFPGDARTAAMTDVVGRMLQQSRQIESFDTAKALRDNDRGRRLFAYAYLIEHPDPQYLELLLDAVLQEDKPFGQYWALQSIGRVMSKAESLSSEMKSRLLSLSGKFPAGTDRAYEAKKLLREVR